jgi:predicted ArsR family transcriptional regulator
MGYYNTTNETGADLSVSVEKNEKQEAVVLRLFQSVGEWQPSHIYEALKVYPITSIRRTLTDLTARGYLIKSDVKKKGMYGKSEHVWRIRS